MQTPRFLRPPRPVYLALTLLCAGLLAYGYHLQFVQGLSPCPLCILQRIAYLAVLLVCLLAFLHGPRTTGARVYSALAACCAAVGAAIAARQVWLQHLPEEQVPECGPGLNYMLQTHPLPDALQIILAASGECAEVDWLFLNMSIAEWSLTWFILILTATITHAARTAP